MHKLEDFVSTVPDLKEKYSQYLEYLNNSFCEECKSNDSTKKVRLEFDEEWKFHLKCQNCFENSQPKQPIVD